MATNSMTNIFFDCRKISWRNDAGASQKAAIALFAYAMSMRTTTL